MRTVGAYGAALAMVPYVLIKVVWVAGALAGLLPPAEKMSVAGFVVLNVVTIGMALAGIGLALALVRPWGERIPALPVLAAAWIGAGFLVPMVPYAVLQQAMSAQEPARDTMPGWEGYLIQGSFIGMGIGLAVALPGYLKARWPAAFAATTGGLPLGIVAATTTAGLADAYWALGGTAGLAHPEAREFDWHLQTGNAAVWTLAGAAALVLLSRGGRTVGLVWLTSGFMVAWSVWKLPFTVYLATSADAGVVWPEHLGVMAVKLLLSTAAGVAMLGVVLSRSRAAVTVPA